VGEKILAAYWPLKRHFGNGAQIAQFSSTLLEVKRRDLENPAVKHQASDRQLAKTGFFHRSPQNSLPCPEHCCTTSKRV
jgi:hypothetical protein